MDDVLYFVEDQFRAVLYLVVQQFHAHFIALVIITVCIGVIALCLFALAIMRPDLHRPGQYRELNSVSKFGPDITPPGPWHDEIAQHDRDVEKWRQEHKRQLEP